MQRIPVSWLLLFATACAAASDAPVADGSEDVTVLTGATLIDGTGASPVENAVLVIRGERLEAVGPATSTTIPEGAEVVDAAGKTIMPGILNLHGHLAQTDGFENAAQNFNEENIQDKLNQYAMYGVLHVVSEGTDKPLVYDIRRRQRDGSFAGARLYTAGRGFGVEGGYPPPQPGATGELDVNRLTSPEQVPEAVAELARQQVDFVKLWVDDHFQTLPGFSPEIYERITREAHDQGLRVVAHVYTLEDARALVDAGVDGLIHSVRDMPVDATLIEEMRARDVFSVATLAREESMFIYAGRAPYLDDPFFTEHVPGSVIEILASSEYQTQQQSDPDLEKWEPALRMAQQNLKALYDAGVKIGFGSDSGPLGRFEGYFEHRELELMVEAGLTPAQAIEIASKSSAEILQVDDDYGTIEPGKIAEFLVLAENPIEDITHTKSLEQVWQQGQRIHDLR